MHDPARALPSHDRNGEPRQFMPAEEIRLELRTQHIGGKVLHRAGLAIGAIVEQGVEPATGPRHHLAKSCPYGWLVGIVETDRLKAKRLKCGNVLPLARCGEDAPAVLTQPHGAMAADAGGTAGYENRSGHAVERTPIVEGTWQRGRKVYPCESRRP
jgi:hypothetical protein